MATRIRALRIVWTSVRVFLCPPLTCLGRGWSVSVSREMSGLRVSFVSFVAQPTKCVTWSAGLVYADTQLSLRHAPCATCAKFLRMRLWCYHARSMYNVRSERPPLSPFSICRIFCLGSRVYPHLNGPARGMNAANPNGFLSVPKYFPSCTHMYGCDVCHVLV